MALAAVATPTATDVAPLLVRVGDDTGSVVAEFLYVYTDANGESSNGRITAALTAP